jgi:hypothetical protein
MQNGQLICGSCGTPAADWSELVDEKEALAEAWRAMAEAIHDASLQGEPEQKVRDRFLENMPLPRSADLLIGEAFECQRYFKDDVGAETGMPQARYRACLNRLELLAVEDHSLKPKIEILTQQLRRHQRKIWRGNIIIAICVLAAIGGVVGIGIALVRAIVGLFPK